MNLKEITTLDFADRAYRELHRTLSQFKLLENNKDFVKYKDFIDSQKGSAISTDNLNVTDVYFPLYIMAVPVGKVLTGEYSTKPLRFVGVTNEKISFITSDDRNITFPNDKDISDARIDSSIFNSANDLNKFLLTLKLKYSDWTSTIKQGL